MHLLDELDQLCQQQSLPEGMEAYTDLVHVASRAARSHLERQSPAATSDTNPAFADLTDSFLPML